MIKDIIQEKTIVKLCSLSRPTCRNQFDQFTLHFAFCMRPLPTSLMLAARGNTWAILLRFYYCPPTKFWEGNVFKGVCQSFCQQGWGGGGYLWSHVLSRWVGMYLPPIVHDTVYIDLEYYRIWLTSGQNTSYWNAFLYCVLY